MGMVIIYLTLMTDLAIAFLLADRPVAKKNMWKIKDGRV
jgi:uncharacterized membrane protein YsdA (DUF1294 family)